MKTIVILFLSIILYNGYSNCQQISGVLDEIPFDSTFQQPSEKVSSINLTGNFNELVISVGFPDRPTTLDYPIIVNNDIYPVCGVFEDGTLLMDYITSQGGSIPIDEWYGPAFRKYFNTHSGGVYTVNFNFKKPSSGGRFLTSNTMQHYIGLNNSDSNVIFNKKQQILNDIAQVIWEDDNTAFDNIDAIHFTFENIPRNEFHVKYSGTVGFNYTLTGSGGQVYYANKLITIQLNAAPIVHERMHIIGAVSGYPNGFWGFPDRGRDKRRGEDHRNMLWSYDMMYHNGVTPDLHSLYALPPILSHDLAFLGWIKPEEILVVNSQNYAELNSFRLSDINYSLTPDQIGQGFRRIIKVMIKENYNGNLDEYFLIEFHKASEFDKAFTNLDEFQTHGYNNGILIWHIKEIVNMINISYDNLIDLEAAVPYNGWNNNPIPNTLFPRDFNRPLLPVMPVWNGNFSRDFDYLDDDFMKEISPDHWIFTYMPDGGRHIWDLTAPRPFTWYPPEPDLFIRLQSMRSDFFTDEPIKEIITNKMSDITRPSTREWGNLAANRYKASSKTHIAFLNMKRENDYMTLDIKYNYWEGDIEENSTMSGNVTIAHDVYVPAGKTLTINSGTNITFLNGANLIVYGEVNSSASLIIPTNSRLQVHPGAKITFNVGTSLIINGILNAAGYSTNKITFDFQMPAANTSNGIISNGSLTLNHTIIKNAHTAITASGSNVFSVQNSTINNCVYGIDLLNYSQGTTPLIKGNNFSVNETAVSANYGNTIVIQGNTITNSTMGVYLNQTSNGNVLNNTITSNMETQPGVMFSSSYGAIRGNQISGHGNGIALIESSPKVGVNNIHHNRFHGIYSGYGSSADLLAELIRDPCSEVPLIYPVGGFNFIYENGSEAEIRRGDDDGSEIYLNNSSIQASYGCNEIYDDREETQTLPTELLMNGTYGSEEFVIYAEGNYWGENNSLLSSRFGNLLVEYEPFNLYSCPLPELEQYCPIIMHTADGVVLDTLYALKTEGMMDEKSQLFSEAGKAYYTNDQSTAKEKYALIINNYGTEKDAINAYWRFYKLQQESNGSINSFRELINNKKALTNDSVLIWTMNNLLGISLTQIEAYTEAISYYEDNIQTNPESDISLNSQLNIMTLSLLNGISGLGKIATSYGVSNREEYISRRKELLEKKFGKSDNQITGEQIPTEYALFQNYPNPFNPTTTITYQIPKEGLVTLKIYDILGKEVTTLINEEKQAGKYSIDFNASKLSSGVYLYELRSNEYRSTKKLLLMK
jgi:tetratricopeptide (TPR) repeat protein